MRKSLMRMTLRQLQIFNEVCDLRSYSRAAEEMSLTQPAVSLQIRQLEELIGQPLFDYVGKKLYMTEAAEALQRASRDIFGRLENLDMQLSDMQGSLQGQLKLAVESSAKYFVPSSTIRLSPWRVRITRWRTWARCACRIWSRIRC